MNRQDTANERGATLVSYALLVGALAMVAVGSLTQVGAGVDDRFTETGEAFQAVDAGSPTVDIEDEEEEEEEPIAPDDGGATGGGESGEGGSGGDGEGTPPDEDEDADLPDDEESDTDPLDEAGGSSGIPGDGTDPDPDPDPVDDDDDGSTGGNDDGDGSGDDASEEVSETVGVFGEFTVVFKVVDGKVVISSVASYGWEYKVQVDNGKSVRIRFSNGEKGKNKKTVVVEAWLDSEGKLKTSME